jgi:hypothetical protein
MAERSASGDSWAITTFFNPSGYRRRLANYRLFRSRLALPLLAVELAFGPDFELDNGDAEQVIRLRGGDVMWQKERLLNIALDALPASCTNVVSLDCDVIFERDDWPERAVAMLDRFALVQPFGRVLLRPRDWLPGGGGENEGVLYPPAYYVEAGVSPAECLGDISPPITCAPGLAWVARRTLLAAHRFYDVCIVGGSDNLMMASAYGYFEIPATHQKFSEARRRHHMAWAGPFHKEVRGRIGYVDGDVNHLWHGDRKDRRYSERHAGLARFDFDPTADIAQSDGGPWRWNSAKPAMHDYVRDYFSGRKEDG